MAPFVRNLIVGVVVLLGVVGLEVDGQQVVRKPFLSSDLGGGVLAV